MAVPCAPMQDEWASHTASKTAPKSIITVFPVIIKGRLMECV